VFHTATGYSLYEMIFGRLPHASLELDLGIPLKTPCSEHEYSASIRCNFRVVAEVARKHLACRRSRYTKSDIMQKDNWAPLAPCQSVWLRSPKNWKLGKMDWTIPNHLFPWVQL